MNYKILFYLLTVILLTPVLSFSAQSTADVSASPELKASARIEILGDRASQIPSEDEYVIGHGDVLSVSIYGEGSMAVGSTGDGSGKSSNGVWVMIDGRASLKHIGDVEVVGMTLTELADYLKKLYTKIYDEPIITTTLIQSNSLRYTIMGNVANPGVFPLEYPFTVIQVVARSGGFTEWASNDITVVRRDLKAGDEDIFEGNTLELDYDDFVSGDAIDGDVIIRSGDIIIVD